MFYLSENGRLMYEMSGYGGVINCDNCDVYAATLEYTRSQDGRVMFFCKDCVAQLKL